MTHPFSAGSRLVFCLNKIISSVSIKLTSSDATGLYICVIKKYSLTKRSLFPCFVVRKNISSFKICKIIKKGWKIIIITLAVLIALLTGSVIALQNSWVQTRITQRVAKILSTRLNTGISIGRVEISILGKLKLEDILVRDQSSDTLIFSKLATASIDTLRFRKHLLVIDELTFSGNRIKIDRDSANTFNFSFLLDAMGNTNTNTASFNWDIRCRSFAFEKLDIDFNNKLNSGTRNFKIGDLNLDVAGFRSSEGITQFRINRFGLNAKDFMVLKNFTGDVIITDTLLEISNCNLNSRFSSVENASVKINLPQVKDSLASPLTFDVRVEKSHLNLHEIATVVPAIAGMDQILEFSGQVYGNTNDVKGKDISISTGQETKAVIDFYVNGPDDPDNMYLFIDLKELQTSFADLSNIRLPNGAATNYLEFPDGFTEAGLMSFHGNFSGFLTDFVTFGTLKSEMGVLSTDMLVAPNKDGTIYYRGNISTKNFDLRSLFKNDKLGKLTFSGSADGNYDRDKNTVSGIFKGDIKQIDLNAYTYTDITFDGLLLDKMFDGVLAINDSNLQFSFIGQVDLNSKIPEFNFMMQLEKAQLGNLNLSDKFPKAELAFNMNANFTGNRIDNMDGQIRIDQGSYKNRNGELDLGGMILKTDRKSEVNTLTLNSPIMDIEIEGLYHITSIVYAFEQTFKRFIPSYTTSNSDSTLQNKFDFKFTLKDINPLAAVLAPGVEFDTPFLLYGKVDSKERNFELEGSIPGIRYNTMKARDIFIGNKVVEEHYASKFRFSEIQLNPSMKLYNFKIDSRIADDKIDNSISWSNYNELTYSGEILTHTEFTKSDIADFTHIEINGLPSKIYVADTIWEISPFTAIIDTTSIHVEDFSISHNNQILAIDGNIQKGQTDRLNIKVTNFELAHLDTYLRQNLGLSGTANGRFGLSDLLGNPVVLSDLVVENLRYSNQLMGNVYLSSQWNSNREIIDSKLQVIRRGKTRLNALGTYQPTSGEINFDANVDSLSLVVLETFIRGSLTKFQGYASGKMNIGGTTRKILMNGALMGAGAGLTVDATQVPYTFNDTVYFKNDTILFDHITVYDPDRNTGIFNGTIVHDNFSNTRYDLHVSTDKIIALNTTARDYEKFYGVAMAKGKLDITGVAKTILLNGSVTSLKGTDLNISMEDESEAEQYGFIEFVRNNVEEIKEEKPVDNLHKLRIVFAIEATSDAKVQLIYNSQIGDIIKAQGEGILIFEMNEEGNIFLSGNYQPTRGDYLFTLRNVINKRFSILQGGSIVWSGDPYNAIIDLKAVYKLKASLSDLLADYEISKNQRVQVECIIHLENELINPNISFEVNVPNTDEQIKDILLQYFSTTDELNKQMLSLIVLGKFYVPDYKRGTFNAQNSNMIGSTASELFSNQLSNWLSQINDNWDVGVKYRPGNDVTDDEIELALSTQIFNDRVTLNGNIGNNVNHYNTNSSQIVGDFEINVKLVPSGKLQFKAYNRSNNNLIYETAPYTQGVGISVTEEFNTFHDLMRKIANIFRPKDKKLPMITRTSNDIQ